MINHSQSIHLSIALTDEERLAITTTMSLLEEIEHAIENKGCDTIDLHDGNEACLDNFEDARTLLMDFLDGYGDNEIY